MNSYLEAFKRLKDESMRDDLEDIMEDLLSIVEQDRGTNYVISLLGDYINEIIIERDRYDE